MLSLRRWARASFASVRNRLYRVHVSCVGLMYSTEDFRTTARTPWKHPGPAVWRTQSPPVACRNSENTGPITCKCVQRVYTQCDERFDDALAWTWYNILHTSSSERYYYFSPPVTVTIRNKPNCSVGGRCDEFGLHRKHRRIRYKTIVRRSNLLTTSQT